MLRIRGSLPSLLSALAAVCLLAVPGCEGPRETIKGTVVFPPGAEPAQGDAVSIGFVPDVKGAPAGSGTFSAADRSFVVKDADGHNGLPPGKYKIIVQAAPYSSGPDADQRRAVWNDMNKRYNTDNSKLNYEVTTAPTQTITIDLVNGTVTKG